MLKMKTKCERCSQSLAPADLAYICSYECTFCEACTREMENVCPNCDGGLVTRPTRVRGVLEVATSQAKRKLFGN